MKPTASLSLPVHGTRRLKRRECEERRAFDRKQHRHRHRDNNRSTMTADIEKQSNTVKLSVSVLYSKHGRLSRANIAEEREARS